MYRGLYFKIILIFVVFMITVMTVVGTVLLSSVSNFFAAEFTEQLAYCFSDDMLLRSELVAAMGSDNYPELQLRLIESQATYLGVDSYRSVYILDMDGKVMAATSEEGTAVSSDDSKPEIAKTGNLLTAMSGRDGDSKHSASDYVDYAVYLTDGEHEDIIYIVDTQEDMAELSWDLFSIILIAIMFGIAMAIMMSFFIAKAITKPIQSLTNGARLIMSGEFDHEIDVHARDEIGVLTTTFNDMKNVLKNTLNEVSGERMKLETVLSYLKDGVIAFGENGRIIHINPYAAKLFGGAEGLNLSGMMERFGVDIWKATLVSEDNSRSIVFPEIKFERRVYELNIGGFRYYEQSADGAQAGRHGFIAVIHDITSRYELDESRREFVANVSHELRTPLTGIRGAVETVKLSGEDLPADMRESLLDMALEESDRMLRIIRDLLTLSRLDNNRTQWQIESFDLRQSLRHVCDVVRSEAAEHGHTIILEDGAPLPEIKADRERISQVIINIISNSIKYTKDGGTIRITAEPEGTDSVKIEVADNGIGIPEEDMPRMFERFYRVEKSRTSDAGGTGLGLSIVKEIVEAHGGSVSMRSKLGVGTCVTVILPIVCKIAEN